MKKMIANRKVVLLFHLAMTLLMICLIRGYCDEVKGYSLLILLFVAYILTFLYFFLFQLEWTSKVAIIPIALLCGYELFSGTSQLLGYSSSNHHLFSITGSFHNPGPYGGFLAVCISLFIAFCVKHKNDQKQKLLTKLLYYGVSVLAIASIIILPSTESRSSILALGCSVILLAFGTERIRVKIKPVLKRYGLWLSIGIVLAGIGAYLLKKPSADGRLFMDRICIKAMCENGWRGAGTGHFGAAYGQAQAHYFKQQVDENGKDDLDWKAIDEHARITADCPDNAFNEYLFIGVEKGHIVMLLFMTVIVAAIVFSFKRDTIWCYGLTTLAVFALFSYPLHVVQFQILLTLLLAACASDSLCYVRKEGKPAVYYSVLVIMVSALIVLSVAITMKLPQVKDYRKIELACKKAKHWYNMEYYEYYVEDCDTLLPFMKHNIDFLFSYGQSLNKTGNYSKSDSILQIGTEISSDPMFWNVMGNNSLAQGKYREAEERYKHSFYMVPNRLYPLFLLAKLYYIEGDTARFLDMTDRVESFIPKVESVNTERLREEIVKLKEGCCVDVINAVSPASFSNNSSVYSKEKPETGVATPSTGVTREEPVSGTSFL